MKKTILYLFALILISSFALADMGPKPTADFIVTKNGLPINEDFYAKMLTCDYDLRYEDFLLRLDSMDGNWWDNCRNLAPDYGFENNICTSGFQSLRSKVNLSELCEYNDKNETLCNRINLKYLSENNSCYWTIHTMAWGGECKDSRCFFNYFIPEYFKLVIYLPSEDKLYLSPYIQRENFNSEFLLNINTSKLNDFKIFKDSQFELYNSSYIDVKDITPYIETKSGDSLVHFIIGLLITIALELIVSFIYITVKKKPKRILLTVLGINLISFSILWYVFPILDNFFLIIFLGELFVYLFEFYMLYKFSRLSKKESLILSVLMNTTSLILGGFIFLVLSFLLLFF